MPRMFLRFQNTHDSVSENSLYCTCREPNSALWTFCVLPIGPKVFHISMDRIRGISVQFEGCSNWHVGQIHDTEAGWDTYKLLYHGPQDTWANMMWTVSHGEPTTERRYRYREYSTDTTMIDWDRCVLGSCSWSCFPCTIPLTMLWGTNEKTYCTDKWETCFWSMSFFRVTRKDF